MTRREGYFLSQAARCSHEAVRQKLYGAVAVEVHDDRRATPAAQQGEVVHTDHLGRRMGGGHGTPYVAQ